MSDTPQGLLARATSLFNKCDEAIQTLKDYPAPWNKKFTDPGGYDERIAAKEAAVDGFMTDAENALKYLHDYDIDLTGTEFSGDVYYPVRLRLNPYRLNRFELFKLYATGNREGEGLAGLNLVIQATGGTWGGNPMSINIDANLQTYKNTVRAVGLMHYGYEIGVYMRGGHFYKLKANNHALAPIIIAEHAANYTGKSADSPYKLDCGPVAVADIDAAAGNALLGNAGAYFPHTHYISTLGGDNTGYYQ